MDWKFVSGILTAEASAQLGLALTLAYAFWLVRLEYEFLLFAVLSLSISTQSFASVWLSWPTHADPHLASVVVHSFLAISAAIHLHYVIVMAAVPKPRAYFIAVYGVAAIFVALMTSGVAWPRLAAGVLDTSNLSPLVLPRLEMPPHSIAYVFYGVSLVEFALCLWLLSASARRGRKDVNLIMVGMLLVLAAAIHDICVMMHWAGRHFLLTHSFSIYGFLVALSLLLRYRRLVVGYANTESSLRSRTEELRRSYADLEQVQRELSSKKQLAAVGELAAAIAHEVRNPLAIIVNAVAGLRRPSVREEDRHTLLGIVDEETARLNRLVTDLLRFARPVSIRRTAVALAELVRRAETIRGSEHQFEIHVPDDPELRTVQADANLLRLVFDNLVSNACQSMPEGGTVKIVVGEGQLNEKRCVMIEVVDHGHGMDEAVLSRAVDPFFTTRPSGTGLGLPIVQRIVAAHGGALQMESEPQHGTTVRLLLPIEVDDADVPTTYEIGART
jgi:signal transduction histidine kinase